MKNLFYCSLAILATLAITSCDDDDALVASDIEIPNGYALSAGTASLFMNSPYSYDHQPIGSLAHTNQDFILATVFTTM